LVIRSREQEPGAEFAERLAGSFNQALAQQGAQQSVRLLGAAEGPVFRLKWVFRYHLQLQSPRPAPHHPVPRGVRPPARPLVVLPTVTLAEGVEVTLDVDPFNML